MMMRRLILILSGLSLLIGVTLIAVCVGGQWRADTLAWQRTDQSSNTWRGVYVVSGTTGIHLSWQRYDFQAPSEALAYARELRHGGASFFHATGAPRRNPFGGGSFFDRIGFGYELIRVTRSTAWASPFSGRWRRAHVPYWALIPGFLGAGLPAVRALPAWRRRVRRLGVGCRASCGYDLRATPHQCPECGAVAHAPPQTAA